MRRLLITLFVIMAMGGLAQAQTTVNLTVKDTPDNQTWNNGTWSVQLIPGPGSLDQTRNFTLLVAGGSLSSQSGALSSTGTASMTLPANVNIGPSGTLWQFTVCSQQGTACSTANITVVTASPQALAINPSSIRVTANPNLPPVLVYTIAEISSASIGSQITVVGSTPSTPALQTCTAVSGNICTTWASAGGATVSTLPGGSQIYLATSCPAATANCFQVFDDVQFASNVTYTASSTTVTTSAPDPAFVSTDVGKVEYGVNSCAVGTPWVACTYNVKQGTIATFVSAHSITVSIAATNNSSAGTQTNLFFWGHDDGTAIVNAWTAAAVTNKGTGPPNALSLPCGIMFTGVSPFVITGNFPMTSGVSGCGGGGTIIMPLPRMNCTGGAVTGCLISDPSNHEATLPNMAPSTVWRDIVFWGGGIDLPDAAATYTAGGAGIHASLYDAFYNVWLIGWNHNIDPGCSGVAANCFPGFRSTGAYMFSSGSYGGGNPACTLGGTQAATGSMYGGTCTGQSTNVADPSVTFGTGRFSTHGVYFSQGAGSTTTINSSGFWTDFGSTLIADNVVNAGGTNSFNGSLLDPFGAGGYMVTVSGGVMYLSNVQFVGNQNGSINVSSGTLYDGCNNIVPNPGLVNITGGSIFGSCSVTGSPFVNGSAVLSAGWGTTATVTAAAGDARRFTFQANSAGTGQAANPTMTITFPTLTTASPGQGFWTIPQFTCKQVGGTGALTVVSGESTATRTTMVLTFNGTPVAASNYIFNCVTA